MTTILIITLSLICLGLAVNQIRLYRHSRRQKHSGQASKVLLTLLPEQLSVELMARDQRLATQLKGSLDRLSTLPRQVNSSTFWEELSASVRDVHHATDQWYPFVLRASGLIPALVSRKTHLQQRYPLQIDLAVSRAVRFEPSLEWLLYQFVDALLLRSIEADDSDELNVKVHLSFFDDYLSLRYYDEASPLPSFLTLSSGTETTHRILRFWLYLLQISPVVQSANEWVFRIPIRPAILQRSSLGFG